MSADVLEVSRAEGEKKPETLLAVLFGIAAIATAFSSFQASQLDGDVISAYNEGIRKANQVSQLNTEGNQVLVADQALFLEWFKTKSGSGTENYIYNDVMRPELQAAVKWWNFAEATGPTPFTEKNPHYGVEQYDEAQTLNEEVDGHFATAAKLDKESARFDLITVLLAVTLFFLGLSTVMRKQSTRTGLLSIGAITLTVSVGALVVLVVG